MQALPTKLLQDTFSSAIVWTCSARHASAHHFVGPNMYPANTVLHVRLMPLVVRLLTHSYGTPTRTAQKACQCSAVAALDFILGPPQASIEPSYAAAIIP